MVGTETEVKLAGWPWSRRKAKNGCANRASSNFLSQGTGTGTGLGRVWWDGSAGYLSVAALSNGDHWEFGEC
jgi:hypothetical protein